MHNGKGWLVNCVCVNDGGQQSVIRVDTVLVLEQETAINAAAQQALTFWSPVVGDSVTVCDCQDTWFRARICQLNDDGASILPCKRIDSPESTVEICVFQALPSKERFDLVMQKLTEIGVTRIVPFISQHSVSRDELDVEQSKSHGWSEVIQSAAKQCQRGMLPELTAVQLWDDLFDDLMQWDVKVLLDEQSRGWSLADGVGSGKPTRVAIIVGPDAGFARHQVEQAQQHGAVPITLGNRILATETAAIVAATLVQYIVGDYA